MRRQLLALCLAVTACVSDQPTTPPAEAPAVPAPAATPPPLTKPARRFLTTTGAVTINDAPAMPDAVIPESATIVTDKGGAAVFTLQPGSVIEMREKSRVVLGSSAKKKTSVQLAIGTLWSFLPSGEASYEVVTANAVAGVRGTIFYVEAPKPTETYVCACDGAVELQGGQALPRNVESAMEHKSFLIKGKGKKAKVSEAKLRGHTKEQAAELAKLLERTR
jgi:hypothetical protein